MLKCLFQCNCNLLQRLKHRYNGGPPATSHQPPATSHQPSTFPMILNQLLKLKKQSYVICLVMFIMRFFVICP